MDINKLLKELYKSVKNKQIDKKIINEIIFNPEFITYIKTFKKDANAVFGNGRYDKLIQQTYNESNDEEGKYTENSFIKFIDKLKVIYNDLAPFLDKFAEFYYTYVKKNEIRVAIANISNKKDESKTISQKFALASKALLTTESSKDKGMKQMRFESLKKLKLDTEKDLLEIENILTTIKNKIDESKLKEVITNKYNYSDFIAYLDAMNAEIQKQYDILIREYNKYSPVNEKIDMEPESMDKKKLKAIYRKALTTLEQYGKIEKPDENQQIEIKFALTSYKSLLDYDKGQWIKDNEEYKSEPTFIGIIRKAKDAYHTLLLKTSPEEITVTGKYEEIYNFYDALKVAAEKYKKNEKLSQGEYDMVTNFDNRMIDFKNDSRYMNESEYQDVIKKIEKLHEKLFTTDIIKKLKENKDELVKDPSKVYFSDYVPIFKMSLSMLVYVAIVMVLFILLLSIVAFFKLIYDIIMNILSLFVNNDNSTRGLSLDYLSKTITRCTKSDYSDDRFYILTEQKQNLTIFNIGVYMVYLLLLYVFIYFILMIYSNVMDKTFIGSINEIDNTNLFLFLLVVIICYSIVHLVIYKFIFKTYVYIPYKELDNKERSIDEKITSYILIYSNDSQNDDDILVDEEFFTILYDASRIDELNDIFMNGVNTENKDKCLEQKIIIYNLYNYLREYMVFDVDTREKFKEYCTTSVDNKPKFTDSEIKMTFVSMMNNDEIKMIRKYNEDLPYYNQIPDDKIEYFNKLNTSINEKIKQINLLILTNTNTMIPFFLTIVYIIFIVILNIIIFYIIAVIVVNKDPAETGFNEYIFKLLYYIKTKIYDVIIKYLYNI